MRGIGRPNPQNAVRLAGDRVGLHHLWDRPHHLTHPIGRHSALAVKFDKRFDAPAQDGRLQLCREAPNRAVANKSIDPSLGCRGGQSNLLPQSGKAGSTVLHQVRKDLVVQIVKTQICDLPRADNSIVVAAMHV